MQKRLTSNMSVADKEHFERKWASSELVRSRLKDVITDMQNEVLRKLLSENVQNVDNLLGEARSYKKVLDLL